MVFNQSLLSHYAHLQEACKDVGVECFGYLPYTKSLKMPSRQLGLALVPKTDGFANEQAAELIEKRVDVGRLLEVCERTFSDVKRSRIVRKPDHCGCQDEAFNFVYRENIAQLDRLGKFSILAH